MYRRLAHHGSLAVLLFAVACSDQLTIPSEAGPTLTAGASANSVTTYPTGGPWQAIVDGDRGTTSTYRLYMPRKWNGKLVVYAHGIVAPFIPVALPTEGDGMAQIFGSQGYAVALSSYSETGLAIRDGTKRTHQMSGIFTAAFEKPDRIYLVGSSMGGFIVASLAEKYPSQYDGVMPICGVVGGFAAEFAYVLNARVLFDVFYPKAGLPGSPYSVPMPTDFAGGYAEFLRIQSLAAKAVMSDGGFGGVQIALMDQSRMPLPKSLDKLVGFPVGELTDEQFGEFVVTPQVLHALFINDIVMHTKDKFPISNVGVEYTSSSPLAKYFLPEKLLGAINANVQRVEAEKAALKWVEKNGETTGDLSLPTLTLHTRYDTWVPIFTEAIYRDRVKAAGKSHLLVQRTTEGFGHCTFAPEEIGRGLAELAGWVEYGVVPKP